VGFFVSAARGDAGHTALGKCIGKCSRALLGVASASAAFDRDEVSPAAVSLPFDEVSETATAGAKRLLS